MKISAFNLEVSVFKEGKIVIKFDHTRKRREREREREGKILKEYMVASFKDFVFE